ncbi:MAG: CocE/NonD family hydrolase [Candidatus Hydrogenedentes bacterium]|nr:CocE/NonD family hydrolase [Candidatus Hydrogenedentota bacterium]
MKYVTRRCAIAFPSFVCVVLVAAVYARAAESPGKTTVMVPMSDGVRLATDIYLPEDGAKTWPAIVTRTPYNKDKDLVATLKFPERGYAVVVQNVRGTRESEGAWTVYGADGWGGPGERDGVDTVAWMRSQPWSNGKVGAIGFSGSGIPALMLVAAAPEGLECAFVNAASDNLYETFYYNGCYRTNTADTWPPAERMRPELRKHPAYDDFWKARDASARWGQANVPVFMSGGWFDLFERSAVRTFQLLHNNGLMRSNGKCKLAMGPVPHAAPPGQLKFPDKSNTNVDAAVGSMPEWFDHWLKGVDNEIEKKPAAALFVMGDSKQSNAPGNVYKLFSNWPPPSTPRTLYFQKGKGLSDVAPGVDTPHMAYTYDPNDPVPTVGGANLFPPSGPHDQRDIEARKDVLAFTSEPIMEPLTVIGNVRVKLFASSDAVDTDFSARMCDVYPDGRSMLMCEGIVRARFRESLSEEKLMQPGTVYGFDIDLWDTALAFAPGHRIRVDITSSSVPRYDPNPNTGEPILRHTHTVAAKNTIYLDAAHPSCLTLSVVEPIKEAPSSAP